VSCGAGFAVLRVLGLWLLGEAGFKVVCSAAQPWSMRWFQGQTLAGHDHPARRWDSSASASGRGPGSSSAPAAATGLRLPRGWPWNHLIDTGWAALQNHLNQPHRATTTKDTEKRRNPAPQLTPAHPNQTTPISPINNPTADQTKRSRASAGWCGRLVDDPARVVRDLPGVAIRVDEDPRVAAPERRPRLTWDGGAAARASAITWSTSPGERTL